MPIVRLSPPTPLTLIGLRPGYVVCILALTRAHARTVKSASQLYLASVGPDVLWSRPTLSCCCDRLVTKRADLASDAAGPLHFRSSARYACVCSGSVVKCVNISQSRPHNDLIDLTTISQGQCQSVDLTTTSQRRLYNDPQLRAF